MPYRTTSSRPPCGLCERPAAGYCGACRRARCAGHVDHEGWCEACDEALYRFGRSEMGRGVMERYAIVLALLGGAAAVHEGFGVLAMVFSIVGLPTVFVWRIRGRRTQFLREMGRRPPEPRR
ncbi:MAG: hypothetical protein V3V08_10590 [Nannocystaceae bacterium]